MSEVDWSDLVALICDGSVVPVVGPELLVADESDGSSVSLEHQIAVKYAKALGVEPPEANGRIRDVAHRFQELRNYREKVKLKIKLKEVLRSMTVPGDLDAGGVPADKLLIPPAFEALARISSLKLFVSITPDGLLETALNRVRFDGAAMTTRLINAPGWQSDLQTQLTGESGTSVFYPFGRADIEAAITEEDTLDSLFELMEAAPRYVNLLKALERSHLLFLGCNFPDWLTRFWIRALVGKHRLRPGGEDVLEFVADRYASQDKNLVMFLKRTEVRLYDEGANDFVKELYEQWSARVPAPPPRPERASKLAIFISYASEDQVAAARLNERLQMFGLRTWFDARAMRGDARVLDELFRNIDGALMFVPVLSKNSANIVGGYYRREWTYAVEAAKGRSPEFPFLHPVRVDDLTINHAGVPKDFWDISVRTAPGGELTDEDARKFIDIFRKALVHR